MSGFIPPKFREHFAINGLYSDNIPDLGGFTITVSPFAGDASICQSDNLSSMPYSFPHGSGGSLHSSTENMKRLKKAMLPPDTNEMERICSQGFKDALGYLQSREMIRCHCCFKENKYIVSRELLNFTAEDNDMYIEKNCIKKEDLPSELSDVFKEIMELESQWGLMLQSKLCVILLDIS